MRGERSYGIGGEPVFLEFFSYRISGSVRYTFLRIALNLRVFLHSFFFTKLTPIVLTRIEKRQTRY